MSSVATRSPDWFDGVAAGCERLVHPTVIDANERQQQSRLLGVLLGGPVLAAGAVLQILPQQFGVSASLAVACVTLAVGWLAAAMVSGSGRRAPAIPVVFLLGGLVSILIISAGGLGSPLVLVAAALAIEPFWLRRDVRSLRAGGLVAIGSLAGAEALARLYDWAPVSAGPAHWIVPAAYAAVVAARIQVMVSEKATSAMVVDTDIEDMLGASVLRLSPSGEVEHARVAASPLLGLVPTLLFGTGLFERLHVADRVAWLCALADARDGKPTHLLIRLRRPIPDAVPSHGWVAAEVGLTSAGVTAVLTDGTRLADGRDALDRASETVERGEVAKDRFLAVVSHELRTPLNAIIGFSGMLSEGLAGELGGGRQKEYVDLIRESGEHLLSLVNAVLDVSKIESGSYDLRPESVAFSDAVEGCSAMLGFQAREKDVRLETNVPATIGTLRADPRAVRQMLINLISNAIKFTPAGGAVSVDARRIGSFLTFSISDNGIGIAPEDLKRLGKPFAQVRNDYTRQFDGTGLGLALVRGLVSLHGGSMTIESAPGEGTTVTINLPVSGPSEKADQAARRHKTETIFGGTSHGTLRKAG